MSKKPFAVEVLAAMLLSTPIEQIYSDWSLHRQRIPPYMDIVRAGDPLNTRHNYTGLLYVIQYSDPIPDLPESHATAIVAHLAKELLRRTDAEIERLLLEGK